MRKFKRKVCSGTITSWAPAEGDDQALWHVVHADGDEEDLSENEAIAAMHEEATAAMKASAKLKKEPTSKKPKKTATLKTEPIASANRSQFRCVELETPSGGGWRRLPATAQRAAEFLASSHAKRLEAEAPAEAEAAGEAVPSKKLRHWTGEEVDFYSCNWCLTMSDRCATG